MQKISGETDKTAFAFSVKTCETWEKADRTAGDTIQRPHVLMMRSADGNEMPVQVAAAYGIMSEPLLENDNPITRSAPVGSIHNNQFGLLAYAYDKTSSWAGSSTKYSLMFDMKVSKASGETYYTPKTGSDLPVNYYWPSGDHKVRFFAYSPYKSRPEGTGINPAINSSTGCLTYTVPQDVEKQTDILVCTSDEISEGSFSSPYGLTFTHGLTAVQFAVGDLARCKITNITISGVYGSGTYDFGTETWTGSGSKNASFTISPDYQCTGSDASIVITGSQTVSGSTVSRKPEYTLMMIPQSVAGAKLSVTLQDFTNPETGNAKTETFEVTLDGTWQPGQTVTYTISSTSVNRVFIVTPPQNFSSEPGAATTHTYSVISYYWTGGGVPKPLDWSLKLYNTTTGAELNYTTEHQSGHQLDWLTSITLSGGQPKTCTAAQAMTAVTGSISVANGSGGVSTTHTNILKTAPEKTNWDLSLYDLYGRSIARTTANCYVVKAAGSYKFPLVYGNALKNGEANPSAYTSTAHNTAEFPVLERFVNYKDHPIYNPYIYLDNTSDGTPTDARILWQEVDGLIYDVDLDASGQYVNFKVSKSLIKESNAVICVRDANKDIMWSWQIWITSEDLTSTKYVVNHDHDVFRVMPVNLGWSSHDDEVVYYQGRQVSVVATQEVPTGTSYASGLTRSFNIVQESHFATVGAGSAYGYCPYYPFGRKDPLVGASSNTSGTVKTVYYDSRCGKKSDGVTPYYQVGNAPDGSQTSSSNYNGSVGDGIRNPHLRYNYPTDWSTEHYFNLWSANSATNIVRREDVVVKTIYDPSPIGYHLPGPLVFTGFFKESFWTEARENTVLNDNGLNMNPFSTEILNVHQVTSEGAYFYCDPFNPSADNLIFMPLCGHRNQTSAYNATGGAGTDIWQWSAVAGSIYGGKWTFAYAISYNYTAVAYGNDNGGRGDAFSLRPIYDP